MVCWRRPVDLRYLYDIGGTRNNDWKCLNVAVSDKESGTVIEYKIHFYRQTNGWYDEVRYDSHEIKKGRKKPPFGS